VNVVEGVDDAETEGYMFVRGAQSTQNHYGSAMRAVYVGTTTVNDTFQLERFQKGLSETGTNDDTMYAGSFFIDLSSLTGGASLTDTATDDADVIDATTRVHDAERTTTDDADVTDDTLRVAPAIRSVTDDADVTDDTLTLKTATATITDDADVIDATSRVVDYVRVVTDPMSVVDTTAKDEDNVEISVESVGATDDTSRVHDAVRIVTDDVGVIDDTQAVFVSEISHTTDAFLTVSAVEFEESHTTDALLVESTSLAKLGLASIGTPDDNLNHRLVLAGRADYSSSGLLYVWLYSGSTRILRWDIDLSSSFETYTYDLSSGEAAAITDYSDLQVWLKWINPGASTPEISWVYLRTSLSSGTTETVFHTTDAYLVGASLHSTDAYLVDRLTIDHTTDAYLVGRDTVVHARNCFAHY